MPGLDQACGQHETHPPDPDPAKPNIPLPAHLTHRPSWLATLGIPPAIVCRRVSDGSGAVKREARKPEPPKPEPPKPEGPKPEAQAGAAPSDGRALNPPHPASMLVQTFAEAVGMGQHS